MKRFRKKTRMKSFVLPMIFILLAGFIASCGSLQKRNGENASAALVYTCPMPEDSVFSDKPGKCPKCGMDLVLVDEVQTDTSEHSIRPTGYTCPMHPRIHEAKPGTCPICGMDLELIDKNARPLSVSLKVLLKPANQSVVTNICMVHMVQRREDMEGEVFGTVEYNPNYFKRISARFDGRITKLYVKYRFQPIRAGQPIMEVYSRELVTAQNNLLFLMREDGGNASLISAAKQRLKLLGMSASEINKIMKTGTAIQSITVYSSGSGLADEVGNAQDNLSVQSSGVMPLSIKEGMYVNKGQPLFLLVNPAKARVSLQVYPTDQNTLKVGDKVRIRPEADADNDFRAEITEIVPYYQQESKTLIARVPFDNSRMKLPAGSTVKAVVFSGDKDAWWLPEEAVTSLGLEKVVFVRQEDGFVARKVKTGIVSRHLVQIIHGISQNEAVAANAGFLVDSESFIITENDSL